ncbi:MAG TPA: hypothetical protein VIC57_07950, partial [Candidatus Dormibacteraeota bacterium]
MTTTRVGRSIRSLAGGLTAAILGWLLLGAAPVAATDGGAHGTVVGIDTGLIRGMRAGGVDSFLGIPY